ncbi:fumarylacetoacetate hydrolase family protein [Novosphingobium flavum]|uniref:Fumarylacetoacetate hydrolase family protein n=1 Tax=Novosphingobium flavum TaxID=1778672 RepID=A0A7X1FT07_9SPHN|nr:fumarylacetoacetate hydrolase family protein [Novosphingobium flavum]MBC2666430.1 fumarylacetoacetate hydrolase family protein [Novosphingobium flavum]
MKLVRFGPRGAEKPGLIDDQGQVRDLSGHVPDIAGEWLDPARLQTLRSIAVEALPVVSGPQRMGVPVAGTRQFLAIGLNYRDHAEEAGMAVPPEPILFTKAVSCLQGPDDDVRRPRGAEKMDWEVELGIVIGKRAAYVEKDEAMAHVAGLVVCDDLSERSFQMERMGTWDKGKGCDTFGPVGPWLVTLDEVGDPQDLGMWLDVNGQRMQTGNTRTMIFDCATIVSYLSQFMVLLPGDIIATGTPPGVGMGKVPPVYLKEGDVVELGIDKLGTQRHVVRGWDAV